MMTSSTAKLIIRFSDFFANVVRESSIRVAMYFLTFLLTVAEVGTNKKVHVEIARDYIIIEGPLRDLIASSLSNVAFIQLHLFFVQKVSH